MGLSWPPSRLGGGECPRFAGSHPPSGLGVPDADGDAVGCQGLGVLNDFTRVKSS
jgi:hypothetical protein